MKPERSPENLKKKRLLVLLGVLLATAVLVLLNMVDFTPAVDDVTTEPYTPETQPIQNFYPAPEGDIFKNQGYLRLDRTLHYTYNSQTVSPDRNNRFDQPYDAFFLDYFEALQKGDAKTLNALCSEVYFRTHDKLSSISPQMVYDLEIIRTGDPVIITEAEKEEDKAYLGDSLVFFEVRYKIYQNDGSFRRDIVDDEVIPQIFTLLIGDDGRLSLNAISYFRPTQPSGGDRADGELLSLVMPLVWLVLFVVLLVTALIVKKRLLLSLTLSALVTFLVSIKGMLLLQVLSFLLVTVACFFLLKLIKAKKKA